MLDGTICSDLSARCGGDVYIGAWGEESALECFKNLTFDCVEKIVFTQRDGGCPVHIFASGLSGGFNADGTEFSSRTEGKARAVVYFSQEGRETAEEFAQNCGCPALFFNGENATDEEKDNLLRTLLFEFPAKRVDVDIPEWTQVMPQENSAIAELLSCVTQCCSGVNKMRDIAAFDDIFRDAKYWGESVYTDADLKTGCVKIKASARDGIFYEMLSEIAGDEITGEYSLMRFVRSSAEAKRGYAKVKDALECASVNGYGIVAPSDEDIAYEAPSVIRQGSNVGIKLKASAPSYHIIRVDVSGEVNPVMGSATHSENMVQGMMSGFERNAEEAWNTDLFGKSLKGMVQEGLSVKVNGLAEEARSKLRRAISRMVNEGKGGAIVIIL